MREKETKVREMETEVREKETEVRELETNVRKINIDLYGKIIIFDLCSQTCKLGQKLERP